ncbi:MAG: hypothetical protein GEU93_07170 [Propionibacteriales bacterium]|nr:hypothetical protein [Propionibacteriales bacterium]
MVSRRRATIGVLGIAISLVVAACGAGETSGDDRTITLRVGAGHGVGGITYSTWMDGFFVPELEKRVAEETEYTIDTRKAFGGSIAQTDEVLHAVDTGVLDIAGMCYCFFPSELFLHSIDYFVPFSSPDPVLALEAFREVFDEVPYMTEVLEDEYNQRLLGLYTVSSYELLTQFPIDSIESLQGHTVTAAGANLPWFPEAAGVTGVQGALPEWYTGLQTGVYEAALMFPESTVGFKLFEVADYYTLIGFGASPQGGVHINQDTFNELPEEVQDIVVEVGEEFEQRVAQQVAKEREAAMDTMREAGTKITTLDPEARAEWANALPEIPKLQLQEAESRGLESAREVFETYIEAQEERGYDFPRDWEL